MHTLIILSIIFGLGIIPAAILSYIIFTLTHWSSSCSDTGEKFVFALAALLWPLTITVIGAGFLFGLIVAAYRSHQYNRRDGRGYL